MEETSLNAPSSDVVPLTTSSPPTAPDARRVARAAPKEVALLALIAAPFCIIIITFAYLFLIILYLTLLLNSLFYGV